MTPRTEYSEVKRWLSGMGRLSALTSVSSEQDLELRPGGGPALMVHLAPGVRQPFIEHGLADTLLIFKGS